MRSLCRTSRKSLAVKRTQLALLVRRALLALYKDTNVGSDGHVYTWGEPSRGKLGHGTEISLSGFPRRVEFFENKKFVSVQCGWDHTCAIGGAYNNAAELIFNGLY